MTTKSTLLDRQLNFHAGPLVWIDCEMTGLDPKHDKLLEIAVSWYISCIPRISASSPYTIGDHYRRQSGFGGRRH